MLKLKHNLANIYFTLVKKTDNKNLGKENI